MKMINKNTLKFLSDLKSNNSREWLEENKTRYVSAKSNLQDLAENLIDEIAQFDFHIARADLVASKCLTRINRDLRFAKDRTPYKTDFYIVLNKDGKNSVSAFYYLHIEPKNCFVGGGVYNPLPQQLTDIRREIESSFDEWQKIISADSFVQTFPSGINDSGRLKKVPRLFDSESPAAEFLKMKGFYTMQAISDKEITLPATFDKVIGGFKTAKPLVDFLNRAIHDDK